MVLFLFVVMMLDINITVLREGFARYFPIGSIVGLLILLEIILVVGSESFDLVHYPVPEVDANAVPNTIALGRILYTQYLYPLKLLR